MKIHKVLAVFVISALFLITSCNIDGEEDIDWRPGDSLIIQGSSEVEAGTVGEPYFVEGFTVKEEYNWEVNGSAVTPVRGGEFIMVDFPTEGDYTITVSNGTYEGTLTVTAVPPSTE